MSCICRRIVTRDSGDPDLLYMTRGTDQIFEFILTGLNDEPIDISLDTVSLSFYSSPGVLELAKTNGPGAHLDPTSGRTSFLIEHDDFPTVTGYDNLTWLYELRRTDSDGKVYLHLTGALLLIAPAGA